MGTPRRLWRRFRTSLSVAIGDVTFGMEDGAVSVAGLVFGVAASTNDPQIVLLAGATGAVAGAVSMMAGTYLDVQSVRHRDEAQRDAALVGIEQSPAPYLQRAEERMRAAGYTATEADGVINALSRNKDALLDYVVAFELGIAGKPDAAPWTHALWMFFADLAAASVPVLPFAIFPMQTARIVSLLVTGALMAVLGIARGRIGHVNKWRTAIETMTIAGLAALAGVLIGRLVT